MLNIRDIELDQIRIDGGTQPRATIDMQVVNDYGSSFEMGATFPPIDVFFDGKEYWLADGFHRYHGARSASVHELSAAIHTGTVRDAILFSLGCNDKHGLRRTNEDKRHSVTTMLMDEEWARWSDRSIAEKCGVGHQLVASVREKLDESSTFPREVQYTTSTGKTAMMPVRPRETVTAEDDDLEHALPPVATAPVHQEQRQPIEDQPAPQSNVSPSSGTNEWYTPAELIEAARRCLGSIDLDPASCEFANKTVKATTFYSIDDDGLSKEWVGRVWMNPPYSNPEISNFIEKFIEEYAAKRVTSAIILVNNNTETEWGQSLLSAADGVCFKCGRVRFTGLDGKVADSPRQGQFIVYFGKRPAVFRGEFEKFGICGVLK